MVGKIVIIRAMAGTIVSERKRKKNIVLIIAIAPRRIQVIIRMWNAKLLPLKTYSVWMENGSYMKQKAMKKAGMASMVTTWLQ